MTDIALVGSPTHEPRQGRDSGCVDLKLGRAGETKGARLKARYTVLGVSAVIALAAAIPALGNAQAAPAPGKHAGAKLVTPVQAKLGHRSRSPFHASLSRGDVERLVKRGAITLPVSVDGPQVISAIGDGQFNTFSDNPLATITKPVSVRATHAGTVGLPLRLTKATKKRLNAGESLYSLDLLLTSSKSRVPLVLMVQLGS